jgi:two-component system, LuxR family, sensor kinase FixL
MGDGVSKEAVLLRRVFGIGFPAIPRAVVMFCCFETAFYLAYKYGMAFSQDMASPFWFPEAVLLSALLLAPRRDWWIYLLAPLPIRLLVEVPPGVPMWYLAAAFVIDSLTAMLAATGLRRFLKNPFRFEDLREYLIFFAIAVLSAPVISAFAGAACRHLLGHAFWPAWQQWFLGNALANLVFTPAIFYWFVGNPSAARSVPIGRCVEGALLAAALAITGVLVFTRMTGGLYDFPALVFIPSPLFLWAAIRFGVRGAAGALALVALLAIGGAAHGRGPFVAPSAPLTALAIQLFLVVVAAQSFFLAVMIGEKKLMLSAVNEARDRFRTMADTAPVMIWISGTDKFCNFVNQGWLEFTGRAFEQELGDGWAEGVHPEDLPRCLKTYLEAFDARQSFTMEYRLRRHDGEYRWISDHGVPRYDSAGDFLGYIGSCVDLTDRRQSEERFRLVVETSPSGILLVNGQGRITLVNALAERLFGYPRAELLGQTVDLLVPERWRAEYRGHHDDFRQAPGAQMMGTGRELFGRRKDGTEFPLEIGLSPIQGPEGNGVLAVIVDITARKEAEAEAMRQRDQLVHVARVSTMGQLASSLAHELNQPLGAIVRNAEAAELLLLEPSPDLEEVRAILTDIRKDDQRAGDVIDRMRALMKRGEVERRPLDLKLLAGEVITLARPDAYTRRVRLALETDPGLPPVPGDRVQLQQVVLNLVLNAMDAQRNNPPASRLVIVRARPAGATVEVAVSDHGHGIPMDQLSRVFEPFFTSKPGGLGMGLAISRGIVEAHGGRLWAENNPGGGATFRFTLPLNGDAGQAGRHL